MDRTKIETDGQKAATIKKTPEQILSMTALELGAAIKAGKVTAVEAVKTVMEQADKTDGSLHAYLTFPGREDYGASGSAAGEPDKDAEEKNPFDRRGDPAPHRSRRSGIGGFAAGGGADRHQRQYLHEGRKNLLCVKNTGRFQAVL